jgi:hypothetical protein
MWDPPVDHPLKRMFAGLAEHAFFSHLGVADPALIDYLSGLLSRFVHTDSIHRLRNAQGESLTEVAAMMIEANELPAGGRTQREFFRHVGDFALFWTGLYPESVDRIRGRNSKDAIVNYTVQGKRGYYLASTFDDDQYRDEQPVLRRLSEQFELCAIGLREVRREWEETRHDMYGPPGRLIQ